MRAFDAIATAVSGGRGAGTAASAGALSGLLERREHASWRHVWLALLAAAITLVVIFNFWAIAWVIGIETARSTDWAIMERAASLAGSPALYEDRSVFTFVWSPVAAYLLQLIEPLGVWAWRAVLVAGALAMPTWRLRLLVLLSWPFWADWANGNLLTLIFLSAVYAWRGSTAGTAAFFAFALLIPRPLLAPMGLWILWKRPEWRLPFAGMLAVNAVLVLWTGLAAEWITTLLHIGPRLIEANYNFGPSSVIGSWWLAIGIPLGAWLFWCGHVGWSGLAISPYHWPYYLFWLFPQVNRWGLAAQTPTSTAEGDVAEQPRAMARSIRRRLDRSADY